MATLSPLVLISCSPHNVTATVSGHAPLEAFCASMILRAAIRPLAVATALGRRYGSVWCVVCGVGCVVCGAWCVVCGVKAHDCRHTTSAPRERTRVRVTTYTSY